MKSYSTSTPQFRKSIDLIETTDTNHADNVTKADIQNFQNTLSNRELLNLIQQQTNKIYNGRNLVTVFATEIANYTDEWAWIRARIKEANYEGIFVGDYIPVMINNEVVNMQVAGIDTYYNSTDEQVGHHIDFISKDCFSKAIKWRTTANNNGDSTSPYPYMISNLKKWLDETLYGYLPDKVKSQIAHKRIMLEQRYSSEGFLTDSTNCGWQDLGALWVPTEYEVFGSTEFGTLGWSAGLSVQYPIFANTCVSRIKGAGNGGNRCHWWLTSVMRGNANFACVVGSSGCAGQWVINNICYAPVCFRISE